MKPRISRLTLELYHRGLATRKERKMVEKALLADTSVRERYEAIKESNREIDQLVSKELNRLNIPETTPSAAIHSVNIVWVIAATAVLIGALVPAFLYIKNHKPNKENVIIEKTVADTTHETEPLENPNTEYIFIEENEPAPALEQPKRKESAVSNIQTGITVSPHVEQVPEKETKPNSPVLKSGSYTVTMEFIDGDDSDVSTAPQGQEDNSGIPPGITSISENMFANKWMAGIVIPDRIRSIAKNAYEGNPVLVVNIGADVDVHEEAIPGNFAKAYNSNGRQAGIYRRLNNHIEEWEKMVNGEFEKIEIKNEE